MAKSKSKPIPKPTPKPTPKTTPKPTPKPKTVVFKKSEPIPKSCLKQVEKPKEQPKVNGSGKIPCDKCKCCEFYQKIAPKGSGKGKNSRKYKEDYTDSDSYTSSASSRTRSSDSGVDESDVDSEGNQIYYDSMGNALMKKNDEEVLRPRTDKLKDMDGSGKKKRIRYAANSIVDDETEDNQSENDKSEYSYVSGDDDDYDSGYDDDYASEDEED